MVNRNLILDENAKWNWDKNEAELVKKSQEETKISHDQSELEEIQIQILNFL